MTTGVRKNLVKAPSIVGTTDEVANHLPRGKAWEAKYVEESNLRGLLYAIAAPYNFTEQKIEELAREFDIRTSIDLLPDWEESVGLPDECTGPVSDIEQRRQLVIDRLRRKLIANIQDHQTIVDEQFPDTNIVLIPGKEYRGGFEYTFQYSFFSSAINHRFILYALVEQSGEGFEYTFEYTFQGGASFDLLRCILEPTLPCNVYLQIQTTTTNEINKWKQIMQDKYEVNYLW
jgi:hypothetical protein